MSIHDDIVTLKAGKPDLPDRTSYKTASAEKDREKFEKALGNVVQYLGGVELAQAISESYLIEIRKQAVRIGELEALLAMKFEVDRQANELYIEQQVQERQFRNAVLIGADDLAEKMDTHLPIGTYLQIVEHGTAWHLRDSERRAAAKRARETEPEK